MGRITKAAVAREQQEKTAGAKVSLQSDYLGQIRVDLLANPA